MVERQTLGLHFGLISHCAFVCLCQCFAKFMGPSAGIIPTQSLIKRPDLMCKAGADEKAAKQKLFKQTNLCCCSLAHRLDVLLAKL